MARNRADAFINDFTEDDPPRNEPWSPPSVLSDEARINAALEAARELESHSRAIESLQSPEFETPGRQNSVPSSFQVAALPGVFSADPVVQAVQAARSVNAVPQSFESYLQSVPVEQAREISQAYIDQQNLAAAIAQMQANVDEMAADQLAAERADLGEQEQIAAMNALASAFGIGMEPTPDMGRAGMVAAWGNPADEFADTVFGGEEEESAPGQMSTPLGAAMGTLGQNVDVNPMSVQFDPFSQHQMAAFDEEDPFGEDPFSNAAPAFSEPVSNVASFASPALAQAVAQAQANQAMTPNMANIGAPPGSLDDPQSVDEISMMSPRMAENMQFAFQIAEMDALLNEIAQDREALTTANRAAEQQITQAEQQASLMSQLDEQAMDDAYSALNQAQVGALAPSAIQSAIAAQASFPADPFSALTSDDFGVSEADPNSTSVGAVGLSPSAAAASLTAASLADDPFGAFSDAALGIDLSDPVSTSIDAPAGVDSSSDDDSDDGGMSAAAAGMASLTGLSDSAPDAGPSDPGGDAGDGGGDAGAGAGAGGAGDASGGPSDGGPTGSATGGDPDAWATGGRVKNRPKGLGAPLNGAKSNGLAAMPEEEMHEPEMKVSKAEAQYQNKPRGRAMCGNCAHFLPEKGGCEIVKGRISPEGWSKYFEPA